MVVQWGTSEKTKGILGRFEIILFERHAGWHYVVWANKTVMVREEGFDSMEAARDRASKVAERLARDCQVVEKNVLSDRNEDHEDME
jgi:hypothetical protein